jgi:hypothetical protein
VVNGRQKGAAAEREIAKLLFDELGMTFKRDLEQYRAADHGDLICDEPFPFVIEVKRYKTGCAPQPAWWDQVCAASKSAGLLPMLVYKYNHQQWKWRMPAEAVMRAGLPHGCSQMREDAELDWNYAVEMDTRTAMMIVRELLADAVSVSSVEGVNVKEL